VYCSDQQYIKIVKKNHFNIYDVFYSLYSHQHVSAVTAAIFRVMLLLQEYKCAHVISYVAVQFQPVYLTFYTIPAH